MLTVHHLKESQSDRIIWLCEELGLEYALESYAREPSMAAPDAYKALSPFGTAPVITDGDWSLGESAAIVEYLCMRSAAGRLTVGPAAPEYADYLFWFHFGNGSLVPALMIDYVTAAMAPADATATSGAIAGPTRTERAIALAEVRLGDAPYFAGAEFTAADIMMCLPRFAGQVGLTERPNLRGYLDRIKARPAWRRTEALR